MKAFFLALGPLLLDSFPAVEDATPKVYRLYRDIRFSKDKRPFKGHVAGELSLGRTGFYFHISPTEVMAAIGCWQLEPAILQRYRRSLVDDNTIGGALFDATAALQKRGYGLISHDVLARAPAGVSPTHPRIELLRHKGWALRIPAEDLDVADPNLPKKVAALVLPVQRAALAFERCVSGA